MNDERIELLARAAGTQPTVEAVAGAIKQALDERDREIADWLDKTADECPHQDTIYVAAQTALRTAANELRQRIDGGVE